MSATRIPCPKLKCRAVAVAIVSLLLAALVLLELRLAFHGGTQDQDFSLSLVFDVPHNVPPQPSNGGVSFPEEHGHYSAAPAVASITLPTNNAMSIFRSSTSNNSKHNNNHNSSCPDDVEPTNNNNHSKRVPRIIHQTYKSHDLPANFHMWREECKRLNPCWEFKLWTDDDNLKFVQQEFPSFLPIYTGYKAKIKRIDSVRYLILYLYGGVYFDLDMTCLRPFQNWTFNKDNTLYVADQFDDNVPPDLARRRYANAFMAASPRHHVLAELIDHLPSKRHKGVLKATGPRLLTGVLERTAANASIAVFKKEELFSTSYSDTEGIQLCATNRTACMARYPGYMVSFWSSTWTQPNFEDGK